MSIRPTAASQSNLKLPTPHFAITADDDLEQINKATSEQEEDDSASSSADSTPRDLQNRVEVQVTPPRSAVQIRSRFFADSTDGEDSERADSSLTVSTDNTPKNNRFITPHVSPVNFGPKTTPDTPQAVTDLIGLMDNNHPGDNLTRQDRATFTAAIRRAQQWKSPNDAKNVVRQSLGTAIEKTGSATAIPTAATHAGRRLVFSSMALDELKSEWSLEAAQVFKVNILDAKHLQEIQKQGGFHICGRGHPLDAFVRARRTNPVTGVWCGQVFDPENPRIIKKKFSSFIPRMMTLEHYENLIGQAIRDDSCKIAQQDNRRLYRIQDIDNSFVIECYLQEGGTIIRSAIPVFHYQVYNPADTSFTVHYSYKHSLEEGNSELLYDFEVIYGQLFELLKECPDALVYDMDDKIVVDLGKLYKNCPKHYRKCPIDQGFLVEIPKRFVTLPIP
jgi:hypothetical protein